MAKVKEGDRVRVVNRELTDQDRKVYGFFEHMRGMTGTVENVYTTNEVAVKVDLDSLPKIPSDVHKEGTKKMRERLELSEEAKKLLTKEELEFVPHFMLLMRDVDVEKI